MRLLQDVVEPPPQVNLLLASEIIFFITAVTVRAANSGRGAVRNCDKGCSGLICSGARVRVQIVVGIVVDVICVGWTRFWKVPCLRHQTMMVVRVRSQRMWLCRSTCGLATDRSVSCRHRRSCPAASCF